MENRVRMWKVNYTVLGAVKQSVAYFVSKEEAKKFAKRDYCDAAEYAGAFTKVRAAKLLDITALQFCQY